MNGLLDPRQAAPSRAGQEQVAILGAGLAGLTLALDLARRGMASAVLDEGDGVSRHSHAVCFTRQSLEIFCRLGVGDRMLAKGITWHKGRVFFRDRELFRHDLPPESGHECPTFLALRQDHVAAWLVEACKATGRVALRWKHRVTAVAPGPGGATLTIAAPGGGHVLEAGWLLACDGAHSRVQAALALPFAGCAFRDRILTADVALPADFPTERWFWFDPPFSPGRAALLRRQSEDLWQFEVRLGWDVDPAAEQAPDRVTARLRNLLGPALPFRLERVGVREIRCRRLARFVHGRILFLGDSAHQLGGGNGAVQDADSLGWKLAAVLRGEAGETLIASHDAERVPVAEEAMLAASRSADFIVPETLAARAYRDAVLELAERFAFARTLVDTGRLPRPAVLEGSPLNTPDGLDHGARPGTPAPDAPVEQEGEPGWLLRHLDGAGFRLLVFGPPRPLDLPAGVAPLFVTAVPMRGALFDHSGLAAARFGAAVVLLRPDRHVAARFADIDAAAIAAAHARALGARALGG